MLLGAVFQKIGGSPLVNQPLKGPYSRHDMLRSARLHGIAFNVPDNFPVNSIAACRAYYWLADERPHDRARLRAGTLSRLLRGQPRLEPAGDGDRGRECDSASTPTRWWRQCRIRR